MYSRKEDKRRKTRMIATKNIATPFTHNIWKPKKDVLLTQNIAIAAEKSFILKPLYEYEKLKWHWNKEKKRLREEIAHKKQEIDELFG